MSRFVLSCTTCATRGLGRDEVLACFDIAPQSGYRHWGLAGPTVWTLGLARWLDTDLMNRLANEAGLVGCTEVYGPQFPTSSPEAAIAAAPDIALLFRVAERLHSPLVVITGGKRQEGGLQATIAGLRALLPLVAGSSVRLALEPHYRSQIESRQDYDTILHEIDSPQVGITVDCGHLHSAGVDWRSLIRDYASRVINVHLKDHIGTQSVPIGRGEIDLRALVTELHTTGYDGALAVELEVVDPENLLCYCAEAHAYLSRLVREISGRDPD